MPSLLQRPFARINYARAVEWGKLITITGSAQTAIQVIGFLSGILVIRLLSTQEYALFTLANTMLGTMTMLADSGITNGIMAESGKVWQDEKKLANVLATGLSMRKQFGIISLLVTLPVLCYLLMLHGASWPMMVLIAASTIPAFFAALSDSVLEIVPKLHQEIKPLQRNQVEVSIGRLLLNGLFLFAFPYTALALIANGIPRIYGNRKLRTLSAHYISFGTPDPIVRKSVMKGVWRTLPIVVYHCISGQISIWLISIFGATENISQLGALSRIAVPFGILGAIFSTLIIPRFARMAENNDKLLSRFLMTQLITLGAGSTLLFLIWLCSNSLLWVLGKNYYGLNHELVILGAINCAGIMSTICSQLNLSRGWFIKPYFLIIFNFISTLIGFTVFDIHTLVGTLRFTLALTLCAYFIDLIYGILSIKRISDIYQIK